MPRAMPTSPTSTTAPWSSSGRNKTATWPPRPSWPGPTPRSLNRRVSPSPLPVPCLSPAAPLPPFHSEAPRTTPPSFSAARAPRAPSSSSSSARATPPAATSPPSPRQSRPCTATAPTRLPASHRRRRAPTAGAWSTAATPTTPISSLCRDASETVKVIGYGVTGHGNQAKTTETLTWTVYGTLKALSFNILAITQQHKVIQMNTKPIHTHSSKTYTFVSKNVNVDIDYFKVKVKRSSGFQTFGPFVVKG